MFFLSPNFGQGCRVGGMLSEAPSLWQPAAAVSRRPPRDAAEMLWRQSQRDQGGGGCIHRDATPLTPLPYPNHSLGLCNRVLKHPENSHRSDSGSWLSTDELKAAQAGWWEYQQDAPGVGAGPLRFQGHLQSCGNHCWK